MVTENNYRQYLKNPRLDINFEIGDEIKIYNKNIVFIHAIPLDEIPKDKFLYLDGMLNNLLGTIFEGEDKALPKRLSEETWVLYEKFANTYKKIFGYLKVVCETLEDNGIHECFCEDEVLQQAKNLVATLEKIKQKGTLVHEIQSQWKAMDKSIPRNKLEEKHA